MARRFYTLLVATAAVVVLGLPARANLFDRPQHYEVLKLDKDGTHGWSSALNKAAQPGAIFYPDQPMEVEISLTNAGQADVAGEFTLELQQIGLEVLPGGTGQASLTAAIRLLGEPQKVKLSLTALKPGTTALPLTLPVERNGVFALVVDGGPLGRQVAGTVMRGFAHPAKPVWNSPVLMCVQDWRAISATKDNGLTFHPYYMRTSSNALQWGLGE